jgi:hypothetical protein
VRLVCGQEPEGPFDARHGPPKNPAGENRDAIGRGCEGVAPLTVERMWEGARAVYRLEDTTPLNYCSNSTVHCGKGGKQSAFADSVMQANG